MELKRISTNKENDGLLYGNFTFRRVRDLQDGNVRWRCTRRQCSCTIYTDSGVNSVLKEVHSHSHDELSNQQIEKNELRKTCKRKATEMLEVKPAKIIRQVLHDTSNQYLTHEVVPSIRQAMYETRRKKLAKNPKNVEEALSYLRDGDILTNTGEQFCYVHENIVILTTTQNLDFLSAHKIMLADGTYYVSPKHFYQLYTIHSFTGSAYLPLVFCFLPSKTAECYEKMWNQIRSMARSMLNKDLCPETIILDFEAAAHKSVRVVFPGCIIKGCRFHLGQAWHRKIVELGLKREYERKDSEKSGWMKLFFSLPFLHYSEVEDAFCYLISEAPDVAGTPILKFADYVFDTYISEEAAFPPAIWSAPASDSHDPRTTNAAESYHRHLKDMFYSPKPSIHTLIITLTKLQSETYLKMKGTKGRKVTKKKALQIHSIQSKYEEYKNGNITILEFLKVGRMFLPNPI